VGFVPRASEGVSTRERGTVSGLSDARFLTVAEVADMMRVSRMTVYRLVHSGDLPAIRFGRSFRVPQSAVQVAMSTHVADVSRSA
jgi:excisionase family DNA binding protein